MNQNQPPSEQQENLELRTEPPLEDAASWQAADPDRADDTDSNEPSAQFAEPGQGNEIEDYESDEIATESGISYPAGSEQDAIHIERNEEEGGRVAD